MQLQIIDRQNYEWSLLKAIKTVSEGWILQNSVKFSI